ncbi:MAG: hypothetical protein LBT64_03785, partial [Puniceicoccales bacterium]|nr:hypothetical protein [Puniceicoccales bacterium]
MSEVNNNNNEVNNNNNKSPCKNIYDTFKKALPFVKSLFAKSVTTGEENSTINSSDRRTPENAVGGRTVTTQQSSRFQRHTNIKNLKIKDFVIPGMSNEDMLKLAIEDSKEDERIMNGGGSSSSSSSGCSSSSPSSSSSSSPSGSIPSSENVRSSNGKNIGA